MASPKAEVSIDAETVRELVSEQHPDLARRPVTHLDAGWDNELFRLGDDLLVRMPRREAAVTFAENERRWLPELAAGLPLPVPVPVRTGRPAHSYPWSWSIVPWLEGEPGDRAPLADPVDAAARLGGFLRALHAPAPPDAPRSVSRGVPVADRADTIASRLMTLGAEVEAPHLVRRAWEEGMAAEPYCGPPRWIHGDLHSANVLVSAGTLAAVIDFGDVCCGDPATDLAAVWMLLPEEGHAAFWAEYGPPDEGTLGRSRAWAVLFALMLLEMGLDDRPTYVTVARATLGRAVAGRSY